MIKLKYIAATAGVGVLASLAVITPAFVQQRSIAEAVANTASTTATTVTAPVPAPAVTHGHPTHIGVPSLGISLDIIDGQYNAADGSWTLSDTQAMFGTMTPEPNDTTGNTFIYGHATNRVFGRLPQLKTGSEIAIHTSNGLRFVYTLRSSVVVSPTDTSVLAATQKPTLTLQTCTGLWSENRHIFTFDFTRVEKL
jgi:LPXTG-site transpeptidase (sortase) family protein